MGNNINKEDRNLMLLFFLLLFCSSLPPIESHWDPYVSPKWYAAGLMLFIILMCIRNKTHVIDIKSLSSCWDKASLFFVIWILFATLFEYIVCQEGDKVIQWPYDNPSGLSLVLCLTIIPALNALHSNRLRVLLFIIVLIMVLLTKSRTGLIVMSVFIIGTIFSFIKKRMFGILVMITLIGFVLIYVYVNKEDSSKGRYFIAKTTMELIMEKPLIGHGPNGFERKYMERQGQYFMTHPNSEYAILADEISHPLSEFLLAWIDYGLLGLAVLIMLLLFPLICFLRMKKRKEVLECLSVIVFCVFSYPFNYPITWIVIIVLYTNLFCNSQKQHKFILCFILVFSVKVSIMAFEDIGIINSSNILYNKASRMYRRGKFHDAYIISKECSEYLSSYNLELLSGDICFRLGLYPEGLKHYKTASNMCPSRFAPLEGMLNVYTETDDSIMIKETTSKIVKKPIKIHNQDVYRIIINAQKILN